MAKRLRAVPDDVVEVDQAEAPAPAGVLSVVEAAAHGTRRDLLVAMRDRIARVVESPECAPRDIVPLTRRLQDLADQIESLDARETEAADDADTSADEAWTPV